MTTGVRIGKLFGIQVRIDWSWLFIFALIAFNLSLSLAQIHPEWSPLYRWGLAFLAALLFFFSVLAHELAHSLVAKAQGLPVKNITLFLFGGVSNIQSEPESPGREFVMAFLGPLTSLVIGGVLLLGVRLGANVSAAASPGQVASQLGAMPLVFLWLGVVNVALGIFNLIPGFPLDGGRVLRSILWALSGNFVRATRWATVVGQGVAWLLILAGMAMVFGIELPWFGTGLISGIWLLVIGWFLLDAARKSYYRTVIQDALEGVPITQIVRRDPPAVEPDCTVQDLVDEHVMRTDDTTFPVLQDQRLLGLVSLDDVRKLPREQWSATPVTRIMTPAEQLVTVDLSDDAAVALNRLATKDVRQLPVMQNGKFVGLLRSRDIVRWLQINVDGFSK